MHQKLGGCGDAVMFKSESLNIGITKGFIIPVWFRIDSSLDKATAMPTDLIV